MARVLILDPLMVWPHGRGYPGWAGHAVTCTPATTAAPATPTENCHQPRQSSPET
jgi:hypothetical protein